MCGRYARWICARTADNSYAFFFVNDHLFFIPQVKVIVIKDILFVVLYSDCSIIYYYLMTLCKNAKPTFFEKIKEKPRKY